MLIPRFKVTADFDYAGLQCRGVSLVVSPLSRLTDEAAELLDDKIRELSQRYSGRQHTSGLEDDTRAAINSMCMRLVQSGELTLLPDGVWGLTRTKKRKERN